MSVHLNLENMSDSQKGPLSINCRAVDVDGFTIERSRVRDRIIEDLQPVTFRAAKRLRFGDAVLSGNLPLKAHSCLVLNASLRSIQSPSGFYWRRSPALKPSIS